MRGKPVAMYFVAAWCFTCIPETQAWAKIYPDIKDEAEVILEDAKKNDPVTAADLEACMKDWDPETRMTKKEWEVSCKRTLKYFPEDE